MNMSLCVSNWQVCIHLRFCPADALLLVVQLSKLVFRDLHAAHSGTCKFSDEHAFAGVLHSIFSHQGSRSSVSAAEGGGWSSYHALLSSGFSSFQTQSTAVFCAESAFTVLLVKEKDPTAPGGHSLVAS